MIIILQMGVLSVFYIFMALHVKEIVETIWPECQLRTSVYMFIVFVPLVLINYIRTLRVIAVFSWIANILMLTSFVIIFQDLLRSEHVTSTLPWITDFDSLATAAGAILYSFEGQAIVSAHSIHAGFRKHQLT
ncbi:unnamed protein product [Anisakis simplex]|nr:unnamed protein product [Anisakis simplex]